MRLDEIERVESGNEVGLVREPDGRYLLKVPYGMAGMDSAEALSLLYRCFVVFRRTRRDSDSSSPRDGTEDAREEGCGRGGDSVSFHDALGLDELFDKADPRSLLSLCERRCRSVDDPYRRFDRHLHRAVFDHSGVAYLDYVQGPLKTGQFGKADIVGLYCVLALDFYRELLKVDPLCAWGSFLGEGEALAEAFRHRYLSAEDSLYRGDAESRQRSLSRLRHLLQSIDRCAVPRDAHYHQLHGALESYLNAGSQGGAHCGLVWGVNDFWAVWESICLCHALSEKAGGEERFETCDDQHLPHGLSSYESQSRRDRQRQKLFARNHIERRPDLVTRDDEAWTIVDFKYYSRPRLMRPKWAEDAVLAKEERDFLNMEVYGLLLCHHLAREGCSDHRVTLEMWLPGEQAKWSEPVGQPAWDPPLVLRSLPTVDLIRAYATRYQCSALL
ncbi:hypothetical protein [Pseudomonas tremae]|uniref:hypothetical protein n=1 Tax=Pseudomonas tremae TaxID=200454 RepID=UPI00040A42C3|nr:hypothetical protein [Pseudomonas tremae]